MSDPEWPPYSFQDFVRIAFRDGYVIAALDHPVIKRLRGQM
jgi:hypothetical protein